jgi:hypothetical protein
LQPIFAGNGFSLFDRESHATGLISNRLARSLSDIPNSLTALSAVPAQAGQKQKRLLAFTSRCCLGRALTIFTPPQYEVFIFALTHDHLFAILLSLKSKFYFS